MEDIAGIGSAIGVAIGMLVIVPVLVSGQRKKVARVEDVLRERGGMTLDHIAAELGTNVFAKGYLMQALDAMVREGRLMKIPPPAGHPRLRIFRDTKYAIATI